jgi:predicted lactoylglutathione lyase
MIGYATIGVSDMEKAKAFYSELLADIGASVMMDMGRIAFIGTGQGQPMLSICIPYNEEAPHPGNGNMVAIDPGSRDMVDRLYAKALELGASDEGAPGQRIENVFYGAYVRDPDGNKLAFYQFG